MSNFAEQISIKFERVDVFKMNLEINYTVNKCTEYCWTSRYVVCIWASDV